MNKLTETLTDSFVPFMALVAYKSTVSGQFYIGQRKIRNGKMCAESPLTTKCISEIMNAISVNNDELDHGVKGVIPPNVLYCDISIGKTRLIWYHPPEKRFLHFSKQAGIEDGEMWVPGLLYAVYNDRLQVLAFKGNRPRDVLYLAPFMNVDESHVCLGNAKVEKPVDNSFTTIIDYWEKMFWGSDFSHILGPNPVKGNLAIITKKCMATGQRFPNDELVRAKTTLKSLLK